MKPPIILGIALLFMSSPSRSQKTSTIARKVDSVMRLMTLEEKVGQMNQYNGDWEATGPITKDGDNRTRSARACWAPCST